MKRTQRLVQRVALAALVLGLSAPAPAQVKEITRKDVPAAVLAAFEKAYPKATIKRFSKEMEKGQTVYELETIEGKTTRDSIYSADGKMLILEESVNLSDLPPAVKAALDKKHPGAKILRSEKVIKGNVTGYEFLVEHMGKTAEAVFDPQGNELKL